MRREKLEDRTVQGDPVRVTFYHLPKEARGVLRLFWAVNLPPDVKEAVGGVQSLLKKFKPDAKWVEQENLHLTVKFLGDVESGMVPGLVRTVRLALAATPAFDLVFKGCGAFGRPPRVLWVGVEGASAAFAALAERVEQALVPLGFDAGDRKAVPHLTIARLRSPDGAAELAGQARALVAASGGGLGRMRVRGVDLMQSTLTRNGPRYTILESVLFD